MTDPHPRPFPASRLARRPVVRISLLAVLALAACNATTPRPNATDLPSIPPTAPAAEASSPPGTPPPAGQTDTEWGRIWDALPAGFPVYPGATPADDAGTGPASAAFAFDGVDARTVTTWMQAELERSTYRTEALNGPLENGGFVLEVIGSPPDCRVEVAVAPLGGLVTMTVRYGAACPNP